jgi:hypothetical protein
MIDPNDVPDPRDIDAETGDPDLDECERTLLRDVARLRGTRPPALAAVKDFMLAWLEANPDHDGDWPDLPEEFLAAYRVWWDQAKAGLLFAGRQPLELDDPYTMIFWDLDVWCSPMMCGPPSRLPPPDLPEAVLIDIFACDREMQCAVSPIWKRRYPEADHAQWVAWYRMTREFHRGEGARRLTDESVTPLDMMLEILKAVHDHPEDDDWAVAERVHDHFRGAQLPLIFDQSLWVAAALRTILKRLMSRVDFEQLRAQQSRRRPAREGEAGQ